MEKHSRPTKERKTTQVVFDFFYRGVVASLGLFGIYNQSVNQSELSSGNESYSILKSKNIVIHRSNSQRKHYREIRRDIGP